MNAKTEKQDEDRILRVSPDMVFENPGWNVRLADDPDNIAHIAELAESIYHVGVLEPLVGFSAKEQGATGGYILTSGHCRLAAVKQAIARGAPIKTIPFRLEPKRASEADHTFSLIGRNTGKPLSQLELGHACKRMLGYGWSEQELADRSGYSLQHIRNVLTLAGAPEAVTKLVETGQVSASLATQALAAEGGEGAAKTLTEAVKVAQAEADAKPAKKEKKGASTDKPAAKPAPVKATLKHVSKAKGLAPAASKGLTKKAAKQPEPSTMMSDEKLAQSVREMGKLENALQLFDTFGKRRLGVFELLIDPPKQTNGKDPALESLSLMLGRAVAEVTEEEDGARLATVILSADDWESVCALLRIKEPESKEERHLREHAL